MDFDEVAGWIVCGIVSIGLVVGTVAICAKHTVDYYYPTSPSEGKVCVYAHWTWHEDEKAGCFNTPAEALEFAREATQLVKK